MRHQIIEEVDLIAPLDEREAETKKDVLQWLRSDVEIYRTKKPDTPPKHLVSYFVIVDGDFILLVDHINAELWLPTGGHVEPDEHPRTTVAREAQEELAINASISGDRPILITSTTTVGKTSGHTDVSIWYAINGNQNMNIDFDRSEFHSVRWFHKDEIPYGNTDPELHRFIKKHYDTSA